MSVTVHGRTRDRGGWTRAAKARLDEVKAVLDELRSYWPLTLRQVYYQLVAAGKIENKPTEYKRLSVLLAKARIDNLVSWTALEDRARSTLQVTTWTDGDEYIDASVAYFLGGYRRDLMQTQDVAVEAWVEKDALSRIVKGVADHYTVPTIVAKGYSSVSYLNECRKRVEENAKAGKKTIICYLGDLDPSGWDMLPAMLTTLESEMALEGLVEGVRVALTPEQVETFALPKNPDALKATDARAKKFVEQFGDLAVELDALAPPDLEGLVRDAIEAQLDVEKFELEKQREAEDEARFDQIRNSVREIVTRGGGA